MLVEALAIISPLNVVKTACVAAVVAGKRAAASVELQAEGIAAALGEDLIFVLFRVIPPDQLPGCVQRLVLRSRPRHVASHGAALSRIEPAIRSPAQTVDHRMRVFQAKAFQVNNGIAARFIFTLFTWIKEQIRGIKNPNAAASRHGGGGNVQAFEKGGVLVKNAIPFG